LFGTPIMLCSAPLQCFDQVFGKIAHHELGHANHHDELLMIAMLAQRDQAMQAVLAMARTGHLPSFRSTTDFPHSGHCRSANTRCSRDALIRLHNGRWTSGFCSFCGTICNQVFAQ
jgi:hypothetical protein